ncbi:hypothetical protein B484DRAFT_415847 [Ochromonadaceae sp. CCMP2298]|nr:hypothetical protein B484DRAFT_415847 [Ochromonadaceae sp. CCMP2298]
MEGLQSAVKILLQLPQYKPVARTGKGCAIDEESDTYGFSLLKEEHESRLGGSRGLLTALRRDENWNNPAAVSLMARAYDLDGYDSLLGEPAPPASTYIQVRQAQRRHLAALALQKGHACSTLADSLAASATDARAQLAREALAAFSEALRISPNLPEALFARASAQLSLGHPHSAVADLQAVLQLPDKHPDIAEHHKRAVERLEQLGAHEAVLQHRLSQRAISFVPGHLNMSVGMGRGGGSRQAETHALLLSSDSSDSGGGGNGRGGGGRGGDEDRESGKRKRKSKEDRDRKDDRREDRRESKEDRRESKRSRKSKEGKEGKERKKKKKHRHE